MIVQLAFLSFFSGFVAVITPGPVFVNLMGTVAYKGLRAGHKLIAGSLIGDTLWAACALASLVFSYLVSPRAFLVLGFVSGIYLVYLGLKAFLAKTAETASATAAGMEYPFRRGVFLGLLNPKSYPVLLAVFTAVLGNHIKTLDGRYLYVPFIFIVLGMVGAYFLESLVWSVSFIKKIFLDYSRYITKGIGVIFMVFGADLLIYSVRKLLP